jgi:GT2 family glycosyltransferase
MVDNSKMQSNPRGVGGVDPSELRARRGTIAIGITTYNREDYFRESARSVAEHLSGLVDAVYVHDDGSDEQSFATHQEIIQTELVGRFPRVCARGGTKSGNHGVAYSKNRLLEKMLADGADWLFLLEDDILITSPQAVSGYLKACRESGLAHLSYAHHGPANAAGSREVNGAISYYHHYVGAWCVYSRQCLEDVGLFDEGFTNAWEHVQHTIRLAGAGYTEPRPWYVADATGSEFWLEEIPGSFENSAIRPRADCQANIDGGLSHWRASSPKTYELIFG